VYFFFNHSNQEQKAEEVIRILLKQALRQLQNIPADVQSEYNRYEKDPHNIMTNREKYESLLESSLQEFARLSSYPVFILLDAYDEFVNTKREERERKLLRSCLVDLCRASIARILITTRPQHVEKLKATFANSQATSEILGDMDDVERYLEKRLKDEPEERISKGMKKRIKTTILDANRKESW
jgi:NACHT domain